MPMPVPIRLLATAVLIGAAGSVLADSEQVPLPVVEIAPVHMATLAPQVRATGTVVSTLDASIAAEVAGRLVLVAEIGEHVKQGQPVAVIDDHVLRLQRENDEATIRRLQANLAWLERQQARLALLASQNNTAQAELDERGAQREMVAQEVEAAKVQLARTEYDLARARVLAPFDGVIAERRQTPGEYTKAGEKVVRLVDTSRLEISARAPIAVTRFNREGASVQVTGDFGAAALPIRSLVRVGDPQSRQVEVRLTVGALDWVIGEAVEVVLASGPRKDMTAVPRDALVVRKSGVYVFRVDEAKIAHKISVVPGEETGELVAVSGELRADDRVVVVGGARLRDGQPVSVREGSVANR